MKEFAMKKNAKKIFIIIMLTVGAAAALSACKKTPEVVEIDRTFEYDTATQPAPTTSTEPSATTSSTETEETTEDTKETTEKQEETSAQKPTGTTTAADDAEAYFGNEKSVFNTLPYFDKGKFEEYFDKVYVEGLRFSGTVQADFDDYLKKVLNEGNYVLNSQDTNRAYLANTAGTMCVTLLYKDGIMLVEAGRNYWDILTFAETETNKPVKPSETADSRYGYFDSKDMVFSQLPYFTAGVFTGYEAVDKGGKLTFTDVSEQDYTAYTETLLANLYMFAGSLPGGTVDYFTNDAVVVTATYSDSVLTLQAVYN